MQEIEVSVRELRQNLSFHLRRVQDGTTLAVTSRGERVAVLAPIGRASRVQRLQAEGRISAPTAGWVEPEPAELPGANLTQALLDDRASDDR